MDRNTIALSRTLIIEAILRRALYDTEELPLSEFPFDAESSDPAEAEAALKYDQAKDLIRQARSLLLEAQRALTERAQKPASADRAREEMLRILGAQ